MSKTGPPPSASGDFVRATAVLNLERRADAAALAEMLGLAVASTEERRWSEQPFEPVALQDNRPQQVRLAQALTLVTLAVAVAVVLLARFGLPTIDLPLALILTWLVFGIAVVAAARTAARALARRAGSQTDPDSGAQLDAVARPAAHRHSPDLVRRPLIRPQELPFVSRVLASTTVTTPNLDLRKVLDDLQRGRSVIPLGRLRRRRLAPSIEVLFDRSALLGPVTEDGQGLVDQLRLTLGPRVVAQRTFRSHPWTGCGDGPLWTWEPYRYDGEHDPARVVVLSDAGAGTDDGSIGGLRDDWLALVKLWHRQNAQVVLLTPFASESYPLEFRRVVEIVQWVDELSGRGILAARKAI